LLKNKPNRAPSISCRTGMEWDGLYVCFQQSKKISNLLSKETGVLFWEIIDMESKKLTSFGDMSEGFDASTAAPLQVLPYHLADSTRGTCTVA